MTKRYSRKVTRKKVYKLTPKEAETILEKEFVDIRGNKHILRYKFKPHLPNEEGDMQLQYQYDEGE